MCEPARLWHEIRDCSFCHVAAIRVRQKRHHVRRATRISGGNTGGTRLAYTTTMLRLKPGQRAVIVEKLPDLANVIVGGFVIGQFVGEQPASLWLVAAGLAIWIVLAVLTLLAAGGNHG
jgi:hypothetical protein